jgi:hypothetical protein
MDDLAHLADLINRRNLIEAEITALIGRPAALGHIGEYVASKVFDIALEESASQKGIDGHFRNALLSGRTVNVKWYAFQEGLLDITPDALPDYYLVLAGPKSASMTSRGRVRPWAIQHVFLFKAHTLLDDLNQRGVKIGIATSVARDLWQKAEIYPAYRNDLFQLSEVQRAGLALFRPQGAANRE